MTFADVAILLSSTQGVAEYLVALKHFDYSWSLGYKQPTTSKIIMTSPRRNGLYQRPETCDLNWSFIVLSRTNIGLKTFLRSL